MEAGGSGGAFNSPFESRARGGSKKSYIVSVVSHLHRAGSSRHSDWSQALRWYSAAVSRTDYDEGGEYDGMTDDPCYLLLAKQAEIYLEGGNGVERDPQKAGGFSF